MLSPRLDSLGVRPLEPDDADELHALVEANREHLARWLPWAAGQDRAGTERFLAEAEGQFARDDGFQARIAPEGRSSASPASTRSTGPTAAPASATGSPPTRRAGGR